MTHSGISAGGFHMPSICNFGESVLTPPKNHLVLYIGKCLSEFQVPGERFVEYDGNINTATIESSPGGDFNASSRAWYFTTEYETADIYRRYAAT
ncbi:hypothetical protein COCC4DRAFT_64784 [Bipolaris maydis ATCC 48331]|uniref:Uncharacterized protein n=2 Tax=Cochliobolus heterostrophus TaxID=5016 RepID=M2U7B6_COCH5|nr:uncharacterized protein COCC4DRAFT_64784 [Bipolaris maydis ATCC 48331]EMD94394.1 hypothetical protein COCHEDRAFT_1153679 [Bipolaris maydis C5]KAH7563828.1 hypothetical protein BM1_00875 [Bipolaris maydis]ENI01266.1 hypothetical protein COCC4DRAFT_64784 [Bipolaris maydis ATCC 48331]KAJ5026452.1 hypothetical protein J3E73DRAFT_306221 [Bipolaris maydis]KAJ5051081.1 hypothetical protein J3E74DRAFT_390352 [Bipolaris maydis]